MATKKTVADRVQSIGVYVVETAFDDGGYTKFPTTIAANEKVGVEIRRVTYSLVNPAACLTGVVEVAMAIGQIATNYPEPSSATSLLDYPTGTLDKCSWRATESIAIAGDTKVVTDIVHDFSQIPLLAHPAALYAQIIGANNGVTAKGIIVIHFNYVTLTDAEFMDLLQGYIVQNAI